MRGCVMMEEDADRPSKLVFELPWGGIVSQEIKYKDVPNSCFNCKRPGHQARQCPFPKQDEQGEEKVSTPKPTPNPNSSATKDSNSASPIPAAVSTPTPKDSEFHLVNPKKGRKISTSPTGLPNSPLSNRYMILEDAQDGHEDIHDIASTSAENPALPSADSETPDLGEQAVEDSQHTDPELHPLEDDEGTTTLPESPTSLIDPNVGQIVPWADGVDDDLVLTEARVAKGRPLEDKDHTPDRGNDSKRRSKQSAKESPRWRHQLQIQELPSLPEDVALQGSLALALPWVKDFCRDLYKKQTNQQKIKDLQIEVENRRRFLPYQYLEEEIQELTVLEQELINLENQEASLWYLRSRSKWLREGEAPTKYFFNLAKSRFSKDLILGLQNDQGEVVTRQRDILQLIETYYTERYNAEGEGLDSRLARQEILQLIDKRISEAEASSLNRTPTDDEVDATIKSLKRGKSPGLEGVTNDMIIDCWDFIRDDCLEMRHHGWLREIGCEVAGQRRRFKYLGVWSGRGVTQQETLTILP
ncbi:hypothetical protein R1sor_025900 [Riccia sorocarpa]|uniref:CCHC-type domain-containing protein n=1 Tax=Riccia sorocarpa TaxID=122646 RepID=A0ABD3GCN1_9MARC